jgi:hypothetical protein
MTVRWTMSGRIDNGILLRWEHMCW